MNPDTGRIREFKDEEELKKHKEYSIQLTKQEANELKKEKPQDRVAMLQKMRGKSSPYGRNYFKKDLPDDAAGDILPKNSEVGDGEPV